MYLTNKVILTAALIAVCSVSAEAQNRRYSQSNSGYSNNTIRVATQPQTVSKPVVTSPAPTTYSANVIQVSHTVSSNPIVATDSGVGGLEAEIVAQTNAQRARYGLPPLSIDTGLMSTARRHCKWMASANSLQHTNAAVAENIAMGQSSATEALNSWMNSSGHRANILGGGYSTIGVAAFTSSSGQVFWCQQFR
jgi:uncharacterized protein YkwD